MPLSKSDQKFAKSLINKRDAKISALKKDLVKTEKFLKNIKALPLESFGKLKSKTQKQSKDGQMKKQQKKIKELKQKIKEFRELDLLTAKGMKMVGGKLKK
tara:strand:+ start:191 stop:493 length:303 start_codon:yes stop_codon:yes gene_type:complete